MSIPLPALQVHLEQQPSFLDNEAKALSVKDLIAKQQQQAALAPGQQREQQQTIQSNALTIAKQQKEASDTTAITKLFADAGDDPDKLQSAVMKARGINPQLASTYQKSIFDAGNSKIEQQKSLLDLYSRQTQRAAELAGGVHDQQTHDEATMEALREGIIPREVAAQRLATPFDPVAWEKEKEQILTGAQTAQQQIAQKNEEIKQAETERHNRAEEKKVPVDQQEMNSWLAANPGKTAADFAVWKSKLAPTATFNVNNQSGGGLSEEALNQAADRYTATGILPSMGMGAAGAASRKAVMNRAAERNSGQNLSANSAEYKANSTSLNNIQKQFDTVNAFENTAIKNIDRLIENGKAIPDLGARFANVPIRMISEKMIGTPAMAKFKADLLTSQTEAAKVLNSANANGVLSDSARKEAEDILSGNLPYPAMVAAANELKNDMNNRHQAYADQIADIGKRLGIKGSAQGGGGQTNSGAPPTKEQPVYRGGKLIGYTEDGKTLSRLP